MGQMKAKNQYANAKDVRNLTASARTIIQTWPQASTLGVESGV